MKTEKVQRLADANALIKIISDHGRRFFFYRDKDSGKERVSYFLFDNGGRVRYVDEYSGQIIFPYKTGFGNRWRGFSHGGTLRYLVEALADYIRVGDQLHRESMGPQMSYGDMWGYGDEAIAAVREAAYKLPIFPAEDIKEPT